MIPTIAYTFLIFLITVYIRGKKQMVSPLQLQNTTQGLVYRFLYIFYVSSTTQKMVFQNLEGCTATITPPNCPSSPKKKGEKCYRPVWRQKKPNPLLSFPLPLTSLEKLMFKNSKYVWNTVLTLTWYPVLKFLWIFCLLPNSENNFRSEATLNIQAISTLAAPTLTVTLNLIWLRKKPKQLFKNINKDGLHPRLSNFVAEPLWGILGMVLGVCPR